MILARLLILAAGLAAVVPAHAFRCGNELVQTGDRKYHVVEKCGEPDFRDHHAGLLVPGVGPVDVTEIWYYNPGPNRLLRILTFQQGRLRSIETGGRGFNPGAVHNACRPHELYTGMSKYELLSRCGEPVARDSWFEHVGAGLHKRRGLRGLVLVEEWTYTFGSNRLRRHIRIINGRVAAIESGARGG